MTKIVNTGATSVRLTIMCNNIVMLHAIRVVMTVVSMLANNMCRFILTTNLFRTDRYLVWTPENINPIWT